MAYHTPELLLVGAAQNLVLGTQDKFPEFLNHDDDQRTYGWIIPDGTSW